MIFHVRWIFLTRSLRIPPTRVVCENSTCILSSIRDNTFLTYFTLQCTLIMLHKVEYHENRVQWVYLCSLHGGKSKLCDNGSVNGDIRVTHYLCHYGSLWFVMGQPQIKACSQVIHPLLNSNDILGGLIKPHSVASDLINGHGVDISLCISRYDYVGATSNSRDNILGINTNTDRVL